jgi:hypothetical protein
LGKGGATANALNETRQELEMTKSEMKLRDAETQLRLALEHTDNEDTARSCINSFLSTARSVTFVMQAESSARAGLAAWYRRRMDALMGSTKAPLLRFFNDSRVRSIHRGVVVLEPGSEKAATSEQSRFGMPFFV